MSQLAISDSQPGDWDELDCFLRRLEAERFQEYGWQEPYESRGSRTVLWGTGGEIPPVYPTTSFRFWPVHSKRPWNITIAILSHCSGAQPATA